MGAWAGPFLIATVLLAGAGVAKALDPAPTAGALARTGIPVAPAAVRIGGALEVLVAVVAAVSGAPVPALLVAASYLLFAGFVVLALARHLPIGSCGCFGRIDTPPSVLHLVVNVAAVTAGVAVAAGRGGGLGSVLSAQPLAGVPFVLLVLVGAYAAFTALTVVPQLRTLRAERRT
jgi:hypothetical protein